MPINIAIPNENLWHQKDGAPLVVLFENVAKWSSLLRNRKLSNLFICSELRTSVVVFNEFFIKIFNIKICKLPTHLYTYTQTINLRSIFDVRYSNISDTMYINIVRIQKIWRYLILRIPFFPHFIVQEYHYQTTITGIHQKLVVQIKTDINSIILILIVVRIDKINYLQAPKTSTV